MLIEVWDRASLGDQEQTIGRHKASARRWASATSSRRSTSDALPADSHVRLAAPSTNGGAALLRRGYSFTDGLDDRLGQLDAGLFFLSFQRDPRRSCASSAARRQRRAQRVHQARRLGRVGRPARGPARRLRRRGPVRLRASRAAHAREGAFAASR
jgi:deferrochelatase/peroxidase EfeB